MEFQVGKLYGIFWKECHYMLTFIQIIEVSGNEMKFVDMRGDLYRRNIPDYIDFQNSQGRYIQALFP